MIFNASRSDTQLGQYITFGICLPASCSLDLLEPLFNDLMHEQVKNISVKLNKATCQFADNTTELKPIDWATM